MSTYLFLVNNLDYLDYIYVLDVSTCMYSIFEWIIKMNAVVGVESINTFFSSISELKQLSASMMNLQ